MLNKDLWKVRQLLKACIGNGNCREGKKITAAGG